jgi:hypothetical protein
MSQVYIASLIRGDQSNIPARHESRTEEIKAPTTAELFPRPIISTRTEIIFREGGTHFHRPLRLC